MDWMLGEVPNVKCSEELGPKEENLSDSACLGNSGVSYRSGYQLNIGRREGGEYVGLVIHRVDPKAIRGNILWLSHGDKAFPNLRKKQDWNTLRIAVKGDHHQTWMNGTKIVDVTDKSRRSRPRPPGASRSRSRSRCRTRQASTSSTGHIRRQNAVRVRRFEVGPTVRRFTTSSSGF